jgi:hypothetical protein
MGDNPIAMMQEEQHLVVPVVRAERPTVAEHYWLSFTPVLVVDLCTVFRRDSGHESLLLRKVCSNKTVATGPWPQKRSDPLIAQRFVLRPFRYE